MAPWCWVATMISIVLRGVRTRYSLLYYSVLSKYNIPNILLEIWSDRSRGIHCSSDFFFRRAEMGRTSCYCGRICTTGDGRDVILDLGGRRLLLVFPRRRC